MKKVLIVVCLGILFSCSNSEKCDKNYQDEFHAALTRHLNGIKNADIDEVKATVASEGHVYWVKTNGVRVVDIADFIEPHDEWLTNYPVNMHYVIENYDAGPQLGYAGVRMCYYDSADRVSIQDSIMVSYVMKKFDDGWKVVLDHATSVDAQ